MPNFKSDSSFFHKVAMGAIGARSVMEDMALRRHNFVELERGSLDAKMWKDIKRKRIRIPDLVCTRCGQRIEVRTKSKLELAMSHSPTEPTRAWDYGMVSQDIVATPICVNVAAVRHDETTHWTRGILAGHLSYLNEKEWIGTRQDGAINYYTVTAFREAPEPKVRRKGAEEGSETSLIWRSCFSPCDGTVTGITSANITVTDQTGNKRRKSRKDLRPLVQVNENVRKHQLLACDVTPIPPAGLDCPNDLTELDVQTMLESNHLPIRFAGVKLARLRRDMNLLEPIRTLANDPDEDIYVRLEGKAYLVSVHGASAAEVFANDLVAMNKPDRLEAVIALGEVGNDAAAVVLTSILVDQAKEYFLRSAAAYCLGRIDSPTARSALIAAFTDQAHRVREDALVALADGGVSNLAELLAGVNNIVPEIQAGCAEALRWLAIRSEARAIEATLVPQIITILSRDDRSLMSVWLGGQLPEELMRAALGEILERDVKLGYSLAVSWAFARSWIAPIHDGFRPPKQ